MAIMLTYKIKRQNERNQYMQKYDFWNILSEKSQIKIVHILSFHVHEMARIKVREKNAN